MEWRLERNSFRDNTPVAHTGEPKHLWDTRPTFAKEVIGEATNTFLFSIFSRQILELRSPLPRDLSQSFTQMLTPRVPSASPTRALAQVLAELGRKSRP